jgi:hypothetical protein
MQGVFVIPRSPFVWWVRGIGAVAGWLTDRPVLCGAIAGALGIIFFILAYNVL